MIEQSSLIESHVYRNFMIFIDIYNIFYCSKVWARRRSVTSDVHYYYHIIITITGVAIQVLQLTFFPLIIYNQRH